MASVFNTCFHPYNFAGDIGTVSEWVLDHEIEPFQAGLLVREMTTTSGCLPESGIQAFDRVRIGYESRWVPRLVCLTGPGAWSYGVTVRDRGTLLGNEHAQAVVARWAASPR